jgi:acyl-CoA synthetase (AMP-forming)/AMP-acid ligase II
MASRHRPFSPNPLVSLIFDRAQEAGDLPAVTDGRGTWGYRHLATESERLAREIPQATPAGEPLAILMGPDADAIVALLAAAAAGRACLLIANNAPSSERNVLLRNAGARFVVLPGSSPAQIVPSARLQTGKPAGSALDPHPISPVAGLLQVTSGSLGEPRLAVRSWGGVCAEVEAIRQTLGLTAEDRIVCASSIAHSYGLIGGVLAPLLAGAHVFLADPTDDARTVLDAGPTVLFALAGTYERLLQATEGYEPLRSVRWALSAGAPLPPGLFERFHHQANLSIRQDYGTTETGTISIDSDPEVDPDSVGRPLRHVEVCIAPEAGAPLAPGEQGEICVRSASVARGYLGVEGTSTCVNPDGWYHTGDLGSVDAEGRLHVGRRLRPPLLLNEQSVSPDAVEAELLRIPGVREAAVAARSREGGPCVSITVAGEVSPGEVERWWREHVPSGELPVRVDVRDSLPRSPAGKVLHRYLR